MVMIVGDVHGDFRSLKKLIERENPNHVLCLGDFGYWPNFEGKTFKGIDGKHFIYSLDNLNDIDVPIWWIDGNHEDHYSLSRRESDINFPRKNITYIPRGTYMTLPNTFGELSGKSAVFLGGADSIDAKFRTEYVDWFSEESISQKDLKFMNESDINIDVMFTHTAPNEWGWPHIEGTQNHCRNIMSYILNTYNPNKWYFGHFHESNWGLYVDCSYECIAAIGQEDCFIKI